MTVQPVDPIICQHCQNARHSDCAEPRCECACSPTAPPRPPVRKGGRLARLRTWVSPS
jgi:hypothetical protein